MKYMLLIHEAAGTRELFSSEAGAGLMAQVEAIMQELTESGELVGERRSPTPRSRGRCACRAVSG
jgi:hypothetical protein